MERVPMRPGGYQKLKQELDNVLKVERGKNIREIAEARAHGDLSENAEYHAAKERQSHIEGRINELQSKISRAQVIDTSGKKQNRIVFGASVKVYDLNSDEEKIFTLVGADETSAKEGRISITSPVGKALIGKEVGDEVIIKAPSKTIEYEVVEITFE